MRDYRVVNASSLDHAWPSPNAEEILRRAQQAALHTKMDCVWGFTQIAIDEKTQELLTLVTTRGLLRPKVLYFGAKQGPAIFQSLMDSTFGDLKDELGTPFSACFIDDVLISTEQYEGDQDKTLNAQPEASGYFRYVSSLSLCRLTTSCV